MLLLRDHLQINGSSFFHVLSGGRKTIEKRIKMLLSGIRAIVKAGYGCCWGRGGVVAGSLRVMGLSVLRNGVMACRITREGSGVFLNKHVNWQKYWQHEYAIRVFSGVFCLTTMDAMVLERLCVLQGRIRLL